MHESKKSKWSRSVVSDPQRPHGLQPSRLLHPWDFPGKSTGVGYHCLLCLFSCNLRYLPPGNTLCQRRNIGWGTLYPDNEWACVENGQNTTGATKRLCLLFSPLLLQRENIPEYKERIYLLISTNKSLFPLALVLIFVYATNFWSLLCYILIEEIVLFQR